MAINLHSKYAGKIVEAFKMDSIFAGKLSNDYSFSGVKTVKVSTPITVPMNDYNRTGTNRYGTPHEMEDMVQELTLTQDKSFSLTVDKGNNEDQSHIKEAGKALRLQIKERAVPTYDLYVATQLAVNAGIKAGSATAISKSNAIDRISAGTNALDDAEVPADGRWLFVTSKVYKELRTSSEWLGIEGLGEKALAHGVIGIYDNMKVVKVPAGRMLNGVNFIIAHKNAAAAPVKINDTKLHKDPPGLSGNLLEGRHYYDCFVFGARANGVYVDFNTSVIQQVATPTQTSGTFASDTVGATFKYTADGTDPRYSMTAKVASAESEATGTVIKVCSVLDGHLTSEVLEYTA